MGRYCRAFAPTYAMSTCMRSILLQLKLCALMIRYGRNGGSMISILLYKKQNNTKKEMAIIGMVCLQKVCCLNYYYFNYSYRAFIEGLRGPTDMMLSNYVPSYCIFRQQTKKNERVILLPMHVFKPPPVVYIILYSFYVDVLFYGSSILVVVQFSLMTKNLITVITKV